VADSRGCWTGRALLRRSADIAYCSAELAGVRGIAFCSRPRALACTRFRGDSRRPWPWCTEPYSSFKESLGVIGHNALG
jgi:hypothetical protein